MDHYHEKSILYFGDCVRSFEHDFRHDLACVYVN